MSSDADWDAPDTVTVALDTLDEDDGEPPVSPEADDELFAPPTVVATSTLLPDAQPPPLIGAPSAPPPGTTDAPQGHPAPGWLFEDDQDVPTRVSAPPPGALDPPAASAPAAAAPPPAWLQANPAPAPAEREQRASRNPRLSQKDAEDERDVTLMLAIAAFVIILVGMLGGLGYWMLAEPEPAPAASGAP